MEIAVEANLAAKPHLHEQQLQVQTFGAAFFLFTFLVLFLAFSVAMFLR